MELEDDESVADENPGKCHFLGNRALELLVLYTSYYFLANFQI